MLFRPTPLSCPQKCSRMLGFAVSSWIVAHWSVLRLPAVCRLSVFTCMGMGLPMAWHLQVAMCCAGDNGRGQLGVQGGANVLHPAAIQVRSGGSPHAPHPAPPPVGCHSAAAMCGFPPCVLLKFSQMYHSVVCCCYVLHRRLLAVGQPLQ